ncbi:MAG: hypothetical protein JRJ59_06415 [Deltaproteobacteria bacterium]|nr:hypothetical protein [Deltaproteobacteria bacterium]
MKGRKTLVSSLMAALLLVLAAPAAAATYTLADLDGNWDIYAHAYYEVNGAYHWGNFTVSDGVITGGAGSQNSTPCDYRGNVQIAPDGTVTGNIAGTFEGGAFFYELLSGRMNPSKDTIFANGHDHRFWMSIIFLVKTN